MTKMLPLSLIFLLGCPVEPKDVQDLNSDGPGKPANGQMGQGGNMGGQPNMGGQGGNGTGGNGPGGAQTGGNGDMNGGGTGPNGTPPGAPNLNGEGGQPSGPMPEGEGMENSVMGMNAGGADGMGNGQAMNQGEGGQPPQANGDVVPGLPLGDGEVKNPDGGVGEMQVVTDEGGMPQFENAPIGEVPDTIGQQGEIKTPEGTHPTPDFAHQPGEIPNTAGDVLPMYQQPPAFSDFMSTEQITVNFTVSGATTFDYEFVVKREGDGRIYPKVVHKQSDATSPVELKAPASMDEPVWLVITADKTGDGPTPDDLVGGTTSAITLAGEDLSLSFELASDEAFLTNLPWFSQAQGGPEFEQ